MSLHTPPINPKINKRNIVSPANEKKMLALRDFNGLDVDAGLKTIANMVPAYLRVLGLLIKTVTNDEKEFDKLLENDIVQFRVKVHGYKSALANVGFIELSANAKELEFAARAEDRDLIKSKLPAFKSAINEVAEKLKEILN